MKNSMLLMHSWKTVMKPKLKFYITNKIKNAGKQTKTSDT